MASNRIGLLRHYVQIQTRDAAESGATDATITYSDTAPPQHAQVENRSGAQFVKDRGSDTENTHRIRIRYIPALSKSNYMLVLSGPAKGLRIKFDSVQDDTLGREVVVRGYSIGDQDAFVQPSAGTLPDILS